MRVLIVRAGHAAQVVVIVTMVHYMFQRASCTGLGSGKHVLSCPTLCHHRQSSTCSEPLYSTTPATSCSTHCDDKDRSS